MRQNEMHQLWEKIKPITTDPIIQKKLWDILLKIVKTQRSQ